MNQEPKTKRPNVVIIGAGFGGLWAARRLKDSPVDVLLIDKNNYHTFLPLLYQVAAAELEPERIAQSVRSIVRDQENVNFLMGKVDHIDFDSQVVAVAEREISYDYLILAMGSTTHFFGTPGAAEHAYTLKSISEGVHLRNHILQCVEQAAHCDDPELRQQLLTFVVVGGGPTGVEYSGALAELLFQPIEKDYPRLKLRSEARVILVEAFDQLVSGIGGSDYAVGRLKKIGVDVQLNRRVSQVTADFVEFDGGDRISTASVVWTAGVRGVPLLEKVGLATARGMRVPVASNLLVDGHTNLFAVGDLAYLEQDGAPLPGVCQVAMQAGTHAAENIDALVNQRETAPFRYNDRGSMATIGRNAAVTNINGRLFTGYPAWVLWLAVHIFFLIGFRNRLGVLINWAWNYIFYERVVRLILPIASPKDD